MISVRVLRKTMTISSRMRRWSLRVVVIRDEKKAFLAFLKKVQH